MVNLCTHSSQRLDKSTSNVIWREVDLHYRRAKWSGNTRGMENGACGHSEQDVGANEDKARQEWARKMRTKFTLAEMLDEQGNLRKDYFKATVKVHKGPKWGDKEK